MSGHELNKVIASVILASLIVLLVSTTANALYKPNVQQANRGYKVASIDGTNLGGNQGSGENPEQSTEVNIAQAMQAANAEAGKSSAKKCASCHSFEKGGANRVGPNLWNVAGGPKGKVQGYKYSNAMESKGGNWDDESLFHLINRPSKFIPGTKMTFAGISKTEEIVNIIAFLKTLHD